MQRKALRPLLVGLAALLASFAGGGAQTTSGEPPAAVATVADALAEGDRQLAAGDSAGSRASFEQALTLAVQSGDQEGSTTAHLRLGDSYHPQREPEKALEHYRQALTSASGPQIAAVRSRIAYVEGVRAADANDLAAADARFAAAIAGARETGDRKMQAKLLLALGNIALRKNNPDQAADYYSQALPLAQETRNRSAVMLLEYELGHIATGRGENGEALRHYETSLALAREAGNSKIIEADLNSIGTVYLEWADYGRALQYLQEALRNPTDRQDEVAYTLNNMGYAYSDMGYIELGLSYFKKALPVLEKVGDTYGVMRLYNNIGENHRARGDYKLALGQFSRALRLAHDAGDRGAEAHYWGNLGSIYAEQKRYPLATEAYGKALSLAESVSDRDEICQILLASASLRFARGEYAQAVEQADKASGVAAETGRRETFWQARTLAGRALHAQGRTDAARTAYAEAMATVEEERAGAAGELGREAFFAGRLEPYRRMIALAAEDGQAGEALAHAERAKARSLMDAVRSGRVDLASQLTPDERGAETKLHDGLARLNREVFLARSRAPSEAGALADVTARRQQARLELEAFTTNLYAARPELRAQHADFPPWTPDAARGLLTAPGTALIEYAALDAETLLFVVTAGGEAGPPGIRLHRLPIGRKELARQVEAFRRQLATRDLGFRQPARRLYDLLLAPAAAEIRGKRKLCIVPDGPLWDLPFQALQPSANETVLERYALHYAPSLTLLALLAERRHSTPAAVPPSLLAIGNPTLGAGAPARAAARRSGASLAPLPHAEQEVRSLARLYGAERSTVYTSSQASESVVKAEAGKFRVLHFATHALFDDRSPMYSSLVLSQAPAKEDEDGLLEAWEVLGLHLDADLVVLSACQTARGQVRDGEGIIGMSWALAAAGSPATLASQWEVDSASTSELMVEFHRAWLAGDSKAEALRKAALALRRQERYRHPFYWAGFVLVGRGD